MFDDVFSSLQRQWKDWVGGAFFAEVQYSIYADIAGGFEKVWKYADVI